MMMALAQPLVNIREFLYLGEKVMLSADRG